MSGDEHEPPIASLLSGSTTIGMSGELPEDPPPYGEGLPSRYAFLDLIKAGGMGEVLRVRDRQLSRIVALKRTLRTDEESARAFLREAQLLANLDHPSIVPLYDYGTLPDGRLWFTMREVRGEELERVVARVHAASPGGRWGVTEDGWSLHRLIAALESVCQAVAFAHERGVVHRDLKPSNVLIGAFGEVQVIDFGIAWVSGRRTMRTGLRPSMGTLGYMAPEQCFGEADQITAATDAWALGALLFHILTNRQPPYATGRRPDATPPPLPPEQALPVPEPLLALYRGCMGFRPSDRLTLPEIARAARAWIDGTERAAQARRILEEATVYADAARRLRRQAAELRDEAEEALRLVLPHDPIERKREGWALADAAQQADRDAEELITRSTIEMQMAVATDPQLEEARARLADHFLDRIRIAAQEGDRLGSIVAETALREHAPEHWRAWSSRRCRLTLRSDPPGATVTLFRIEEMDRRLVPVPVGPLGTTPLTEVEVPHGPHLLELAAPGHHPVRLPIALERGAQEHGRTPAGAPSIVRLPRLDELDADDLLIPAGWCTVGGDPHAVDTLPRRRVWLDAVIVRRHPVTVAEYCAFLNALAAAGPIPDVVLPLALSAGTPSSGEILLGTHGYTLREGTADLPIREISWYAASAYADWLAARTGRPWRLPYELEWEKAARGVDGRAWPWGNHFDPTWANSLQSRGDVPTPCPIHAFPADESIYGVRGLAGNIRDWCADGYQLGWAPEDGAAWRPGTPDDGGHRVVRGGAFAASTPYTRLAGRYAGPPHSRLSLVGIRLARPFGAPPDQD